MAENIQISTPTNSGIDNPLLEGALELAKRGFYVIPIMPDGTPDRAHPGKPSKAPLPGFKWNDPANGATKDEQRIREIWTKHPHANVAIRTGQKAKIYVVDVDVKDGVDGFKSLKEAGIQIPPTLTDKTWSGGQHFFFKCDQEPLPLQSQNVNGLCGVDVRGASRKDIESGIIGDGGYCIVAPSVLKGKPYSWITPLETPLAEFPEALKLTNKASAKKKSDSQCHAIQENLRNLRENESSEDEARLRKIADDIAKMPPSISKSTNQTQPDAAFMRVVRLCHDKYNLNVNETINVINMKTSDGGLSWNEKCLTSDHQSIWKWADHQISHAWDSVDATPRESIKPGKHQRENTANFDALFSKRKKIGEFADPKPDESNMNAIFKKNYLRKGQLLLLVAASGIGKSTFTSQGSMCWAIGKPFIGFDPAQRLSIGVFETEDDDEEVADFRNNFRRGFAESGWKQSEICEAENGEFAPVYYPLNNISADNFLDYLEHCVSLAKHNLIIINPAYDFIPGDFSKAEVVTKWKIRLMDMAQRYNFAIILVHHTNKVPSCKRDRENWNAGSSATYAGSGSMILPSSARAVVVIRPNEKESGIFELHAAKRGERLGWCDAEGKRTTVKYIAHCKDYIFWRELSAEETKLFTQRKPSSHELPGGAEKVIAICKEHGKAFDSMAECRQAIIRKHKVSDTSADNWINQALKLNVVRKAKSQGANRVQVGLTAQLDADI